MRLLHALAELEAGRLSDPTVLKNRLRSLYLDPSKDNVSDFLVEVAAEDPDRKQVAENLLDKLTKDQVASKRALVLIHDSYKKWRQIARKKMPGVLKKVGTSLRKEFTSSGDGWLRKNRMKLSAQVLAHMEEMIISLAGTVWAHREPESSMNFVVAGETQRILGRISYRPDHSLYHNYNYYVTIDRSEPLYDSDTPMTLYLNQPYSHQKENHALGFTR